MSSRNCLGEFDDNQMRADISDMTNEPTEEDVQVTEEEKRLRQEEEEAEARWDELEDEERRGKANNEHFGGKPEADVNNQRLETEAHAINRNRDEEISSYFEAAKQNLGGFLKKKKQVIRDLACDLERLGRPVEHIAAEIVHELRNCEELSRSQIYSYLDDKYKNQTQAQRRKGKSNVNADPKTGTESLPERTITVGSTGLQITSNEHDVQELKHRDTVTDHRCVTSNQQSNPANLQKLDWNPDPKTGTESLSAEQASESEFAIPKEKHDMVRDAMDKSKNAIFVKCYGSKFVRVVADVDKWRSLIQ